MKHAIISVCILTACAFAQTAQPTAQPNTNITDAINGARHVRDYMKDPESFRVSLVTVVQDKKGRNRVCLALRSKNSFGGYVDGFAVYHPEVNKAWDGRGDYEQECMSGGFNLKLKPGTDATEEVKAALKADREKE
jgi:hypothetical protein